MENPRIEPWKGTKPLTIKDLCATRYKLALGFSVIFEYLAIFFIMLVTNFNPLHPSSIFTGARIIFSRNAVLLAIPLMVAVFFNGYFLTYNYLAKNGGNQKRVATYLRKTCNLFVTVLTGLLFTWVFLWLIPKDYNAGMFTEALGAIAALRYFYSNVDFKLVFPLAHQPIYLRIKEALIRNWCSSFGKSFIPGIVAWIVVVSSAQGYNFDFNTLTSLIRLRMFFYAWLGFSFVTLALTIIRDMFNIIMTSYGSFNLDFGYHLMGKAYEEQILLVQMLTTYDFYLATNSPIGRQELFNLKGGAWGFNGAGKLPGRSWREIRGVFNPILEKFTKELNELIEEKKTAPIKKKVDQVKVPLDSTITSPSFVSSPTAIRNNNYRDLNESLGIRNLLASPVPSTADFDPPATQPLPAFFVPRLQSIQNTVCTSAYETICTKLSVQEDKSRKVNAFLAKNSQQIMWLAQAVTSCLCHSIKEDQYGIVKLNFKDEFKNLVELHQVVEKVNSMNLVIKKVDRNYVALRATMKQIIFRIGKTFEPYLNDLPISLDIIDYIKANMPY